jgi:glycosyltransferase involved in cell wall biosynthesis
MNKALKRLGIYAEPDDAEWVGMCASLGSGFKYKDKKSFIIHVWETTSLPTFVFHGGQNQKIFGLSNQITDLWHRYGRNDVTTIYGGCDTEFWKPTKPKNPNQFQFLHVNSTNVRSGVDLTIRAFCEAFAGNPDVKLIVKDTNPQDSSSKLLAAIKMANDYFKVNIEYVGGRAAATVIRDLYSESHVTLNLLRATSFGMPLLDCSACGSYCVTGDIAPTNELIRPEYGTLVKSKGFVKLKDIIPDLVNYWGLLNCYGNFPHLEEPCISHFDMREYAQTILNIQKNWNIYSQIDTRTPIINKWSWDNTARQLIEKLYGIQLATQQT